MHASFADLIWPMTQVPGAAVVLNGPMVESG